VSTSPIPATIPAIISGNAASATTSASNGADSLAQEDVFLQLLVAQLKNQDPASPADGTTFVTQLAQFTTLEQDTQSRSDLDQILKTLQNTTAPPTSTSQGTASGTKDAGVSSA
jgi:flagellar basal-body rod modification protein FlgD